MRIVRRFRSLGNSRTDIRRVVQSVPCHWKEVSGTLFAPRQLVEQGRVVKEAGLELTPTNEVKIGRAEHVRSLQDACLAFVCRPGRLP